MPTFKQKPCRCKDTAALHHVLFYLFEINTNNKKIAPDRWKDKLTGIDGLRRPKTGGWRQYFPEMAIFTFQRQSINQRHSFRAQKIIYYRISLARIMAKIEARNSSDESAEILMR